MTRLVSGDHGEDSDLGLVCLDVLSDDIQDYLGYFTTDDQADERKVESRKDGAEAESKRPR